MTIDLMDQQSQTVKYPLYDEARTTVIGHLVPDHEGYLMVEDEALGANIDQNGGTFEQIDEADGDEKFCVSY